MIAGTKPSARRVDGLAKVTGRAQYAIDVTPSGALWCGFLRSSLPHARVTKLDPSRALELPGVHAVLTGSDVAGLRGGNIYVDEPLLSSWDRVRFIGDKVAAIAADDPETARRAADLIEVEYEELPAVFDPQEAAGAGSPLLHPDFNSYRAVNPLQTPSNAFNRVDVGHGDVEQGFAQADEIIELTYFDRARASGLSRAARVHGPYR